MTLAEVIVLSKMLAAMTDEQRAEMVASIRAQSGRYGREEKTIRDWQEDEAIAIIETCSFFR